MKRVRCAIYTRKSSEEGLDQDFNSLDAQREACEAYVASQKHEGWVALPEQYDDGGLSGGTLDRPALQSLLRTVDDGQVDQIIVYKIDRLTRSLMDFSRLIERLDAAEASFVSVTQSFNTATSMGRLTLNVLLSFAQFEREVTAERIRDKIAASKKKGLWMGGPVPLGYRTKDRNLLINEEEMETVKRIFDLYLQCGSVRELKQRTDREGMLSREWMTKTGEERGGKPYSRGHLYRILTNPIYIGKVGHKGRTYEGKHQAILEIDVWEKVQTKLTSDAVRARSKPDNRGIDASPFGTQSSSPSFHRKSPLAGLLFDETGDRLSPSHANKKGKRYRYYVSNRLIKRSGEPEAAIGGWRLPAKQLEDTVCTVIIDWIADQKRVGQQLLSNDETIETNQYLSVGLARFKDRIEATTRPVELLKHLITNVTLSRNTITIQLTKPKLLGVLGLSNQTSTTNNSGEPLTITAPFQHRKRGVESKLISGNTTPGNHDPVLIANIAKARSWLQDIKSGKAISAIAHEENRSIRQVQRQLELAFLSPTLIRQIVEGSQPTELTSRYLMQSEIPMDWNKQHQVFGAN